MYVMLSQYICWFSKDVFVFQYKKKSSETKCHVQLQLFEENDILEYLSIFYPAMEDISYFEI